MTEGIRPGIICRISRDQKERGLGVERQREDGLAYFAAKGIPVDPRLDIEGGDVFQDNNVSISRFAKKRRRSDPTAYERAIARIEAGELNYVWMWAEDRTHRQVLELATFVDTCRKYNVKVVTPTMEYDLDDPDQLSIWFIKVRFAEAEVERTSKRVRRERLQAAERGEPNTGGRRTFGFVGTGRNRVPLHRALMEQEYANEAARRIVAGDSLRAIVRDWNHAKVRTSTDGAWTTASLRQTLLSPRLAGYRVHHGRLIDTKHWEPVIDRAVWAQVRAILTDPARVTTVGGGQPKHLLVGWIYCGVCGQRLRCKLRRARARMRKKPGRTLTYYCPAYHVTRNAHFVEDLILRGLFQAAEDQNRYADAARQLADDDPGRDLYARLAANQGRLDRLGDDELLATLDGDLTGAARIARVRARLEGVMASDREALARMQGDRVMAALPPNLRTVWPDLSLDRRRSILGVLFRGKAILVGRKGRRDGPAAVTVVPLSAVPGQR